MSTEKQKAEKKRIYEYYKAHGVCVICHSRDAFAGYVRCERCLERNANNSAKYYERNKQKIIQRCNERRARLRAQGLCVICAKPASAENKWFCKEHRLHHCRKLRQRWRDLMASEKAKEYRWLNGKWVKRKTPEERLEILRRSVKNMLNHPNTFKAREIKRKTMYRGIYHGPEWKPREAENEV